MSWNPGRSFEVTLPIELLNEDMAKRRHWQRAQNYERIIRQEGFVRTAPEYRQRVTVTRVLGGFQASYAPGGMGRGNWPDIERALTACGWWVAADWKHLEFVDFRQVDDDRANGRCIRVRVEPCE